MRASISTGEAICEGPDDSNPFLCLRTRDEQAACACAMRKAVPKAKIEFVNDGEIRDIKLN